MRTSKGMPTAEEFWANTMPIPESGCMIWMGNCEVRGYGNFERSVAGRRVIVKAHRYAYELVKGPIPHGTEIDHLCRVHPCVNPAHLEAVTHRENMLRSPVAPNAVNARKTHCKRGHELSGANLNIRRGHHRECRTCKLESDRLRRVSRKACA